MSQFVAEVLKELESLPKKKSISREDKIKQQLYFLKTETVNEPIENHPDVIDESEESYEKLNSLLNLYKDSNLKVTIESLEPFRELLSNRWSDIKDKPYLEYGNVKSLANQSYFILAEKISNVLNTESSHTFIMPIISESSDYTNKLT